MDGTFDHGLSRSCKVQVCKSKKRLKTPGLFTVYSIFAFLDHLTFCSYDYFGFSVSQQSVTSILLRISDCRQESAGVAGVWRVSGPQMEADVPHDAHAHSRITTWTAGAGSFLGA